MKTGEEQTRAAHPDGSSYSEEDIYSIIKETILSGQVPAGTRLPEARLAPLFGVTRERLRKVLRRLGYENVLEIVPYIGTIVPKPTLENARELFGARRVLESGICVTLCERINDHELRMLEDHMRIEQQLAETGSRSDFILETSHFHRMLAQFIGNPLITQQLDALLSKSNLFSAFLDPSNAAFCSCHEHRVILSALAKRDMYEAHHAMMSHLSLIETRLQGPPQRAGRVDVHQIFLRALERRSKAAEPKMKWS
ncbi:GntR family transcriptional regulator [Castellaniella sp. GW247-6E4]|uniref:GntR family transcriptional regulator n=1 Tax=Castellaniella sp. GW247-6E4 TaxID=3140380 RepID=UPI0033155404